MKKSLVVIVFVVLVLILIITGLTKKGKDQTERVIAVIPKGTTHLFWESIHAGALDAANETGVKVSWVGPEREGPAFFRAPGREGGVQRHLGLAWSRRWSAHVRGGFHRSGPDGSPGVRPPGRLLWRPKFSCSDRLNYICA